MSVICKVKIPPQRPTIFRWTTRSCDNISPMRIAISVIWPAFGGVVYHFLRFLFPEHILSIFYEKWRLPSFLIVFWVLSHIATHHSTIHFAFCIKKSWTIRRAKTRTMRCWMTCIAACSKEHSSVKDIKCYAKPWHHIREISLSIRVKLQASFIPCECTTRNSDVGGNFYITRGP